MDHPARTETIVIVGPGRAGVSLGRLWQRAGHRVAAIAGGSADSAERARAVLGADVASISPATALGAGTLVLVAVPDDRLDDAAAQVGAGRPASQATLAMHLSGARAADALAPIARAGARTAALHPLHAFATRDPGAANLGGAACAVEAAAEDRDRVFSLALSIGGIPFALASKDRVLYHAAAATAGNAPLALLDLALRAFEQAGVPREVGLRGLVSLAKGALDNAARLGPAAALTGPVVRGDRDVIARHLVALEEFSPVDQRFYWALVRALIRTAAHRPDGWKALQVASAHDDLGKGAAIEGDA
jgi:predicted short-subunit dehydrogenase-like oxidoreductase (DUF2520 family)